VSGLSGISLKRTQGRLFQNWLMCLFALEPRVPVDLPELDGERARRGLGLVGELDEGPVDEPRGALRGLGGAPRRVRDRPDPERRVALLWGNSPSDTTRIQGT